MNINDDVYGRNRVSEPVLIELMRSEAMLRLRGVLQHGITGLIGITRATTRYEHSVGTMLLVRQLGGPIKEQIAALIHDVSHTAFSHVIDYVFQSHEEQNYHDTVKKSYIASTDLPGLLAKWDYDWRDFLEEERYPLLEKPAPALCADRIDYFLRDALGLGAATASKVAWACSSLSVMDSQIVVDNLDAARWFGYTYMKVDQASWANFREVALYELTAMVIRRGLEIGLIDDGDFWRSDRDLWEILKASEDPIIHDRLGYVSEDTEFEWDEVNSDFEVNTKIRTIDPDVRVGSERNRLSALDQEFAAARISYTEQKSGIWPIRIVQI